MCPYCFIMPFHHFPSFHTYTGPSSGSLLCSVSLSPSLLSSFPPSLSIHTHTFINVSRCLVSPLSSLAHLCPSFNFVLPFLAWKCTCIWGWTECLIPRSAQRMCGTDSWVGELLNPSEPSVRNDYSLWTCKNIWCLRFLNFTHVSFQRVFILPPRK